MTRVNKVPAVGVFPVNREPETSQQLPRPFQVDQNIRILGAWRALVSVRRHRQYCNIHCNTPQQIQQPHHQKHATCDNKPEKKLIYIYIIEKTLTCAYERK